MNNVTYENSDFAFETTEIDGVWLITPFVRHDDRGCFIKDYNEMIFREKGIDYTVRETFSTFSKKNTIRGLHFQREKQMPKLVRCIKGKIFDVAVDIRKDSLTFSKWIGFELSDENNQMLLIPSGCLHGFLALTDALVSYKCAEIFYPDYDDGIRWDDPDIGIEWPVAPGSEIILSERDSQLGYLRDLK